MVYFELVASDMRRFFFPTEKRLCRLELHLSKTVKATNRYVTIIWKLAESDLDISMICGGGVDTVQNRLDTEWMRSQK